MFTAFFYRIRLLLDKLSLRERYLLLIIAFASILGFTQLGLIAVGLDKHDAVIDDINRLKQETAQYQETLDALLLAAQNPRILNLVANNHAIQQSIADLDQRIDAVAQSLISPAQMVQLVQRLLDQQTNLTLLSFNVLPVVQLDSGSGSEMPFYQHGLVLELSGQYEALLSYLERIELATDQHLFWQSLEINTDRFPTLSIRLQVHTLSRQKEWLNV